MQPSLLRSRVSSKAILLPRQDLLGTPDTRSTAAIHLSLPGTHLVATFAVENAVFLDVLGSRGHLGDRQEGQWSRRTASAEAAPSSLPGFELSAARSLNPCTTLFLDPRLLFFFFPLGSLLRLSLSGCLLASLASDALFLGPQFGSLFLLDSALASLVGFGDGVLFHAGLFLDLGACLELDAGIAREVRRTVCVVFLDVEAHCVGEEAWTTHFDVRTVRGVAARMHLLPVQTHCGKI